MKKLNKELNGTLIDIEKTVKEVTRIVAVKGRLKEMGKGTFIGHIIIGVAVAEISLSIGTR